MEEHEELVEKIKKLPKIEAPTDFSDTVMQRIAGLAPSRSKPVHDAVSMTRGQQLRWKAIISGTVSRQQVAFALWVIGFFYVCFGLALAAGFRMAAIVILAHGWLGLQPFITAGLGVVLLCLGSLIRKDSPVVWSIAQGGVVLFLLLVIVNGLIVQRILGLSSSVVGFLSFIGGGVLIGGFLLVLLSREQKSFLTG